MKISILALLFFFEASLFFSCSGGRKEMNDMLVYVGTYTEADSQGIEIYHLDEAKGSLSLFKTIPGIKNPSYLCFSSDQRFLYAVNELLKSDDQPTGTVSAFAVDARDGGLNLINHVPSLGRAPCYITISNDNRFVLFNNYLDGTAVSLSVMGNGGLGQPVSVLHFSGFGPVKGRQDASHVHSINPDPQNKFVLVADLGTDKLSVFSFDSKSGQLEEVKNKSVQTARGAGPRHLVFSADGKRVYVSNELNSTVEAYYFDREKRSLQHFQTIGTLPGDFKGVNYPADIHLSPDGRFLYVSNRGHESIAIFSVQKNNGNLTFLATTSVYGSWPRNFVISRDGKYLLVANQKSRNIVTFRRDAGTGLLRKLSSVQSIAAPTCLQILERIHPGK